jgi:hypothetical protein
MRCTVPGFLLCVPIDRTSFMGPSSWELRVRTHPFVSWTPASWRNPPRLPPSENGEWWEIGDESRGGIPYYYHTKSGETVWEKPDGFVIPLTVLQVRPLPSSIHTAHRFQMPPSPTRIPPWAVVSQSHSLQPRTSHRLHVRRYKSKVPWLTVHAHIRRKHEVMLMPLAGFSPLQAVPLPPPRRTRTPPLCDATLLPTLIMPRRRASRRRFRRSPAQRRAPRLPQRPPTVPSSLVDPHRSR